MDLHPHEIKILKALKRESTPGEIAKAADIPLDAVMRASSWLQTKNLVDVKEDISEEVKLGDEGKGYAKLKGGNLPERILLHIIPPGERGIDITDLRDRVKSTINDKEFNIGLNWLTKKKLAFFSRGRVFVSKSVDYDTLTPDEKLFKKLIDAECINTKELTSSELGGLDLLRSRKSVVDVRSVKEIKITPTKRGLELEKTLKEDDSISQLTPKVIMSDEWEKRKFRPYDVGIYVKPHYPVRKHPLQKAVDQVRSIFLRMGFKEIAGPLVESAFWNFDALFTAQDHPVRDMHDTFYLKKPKRVDIPGFEKFKDRVKKTHEDGWTTGSTGWRYGWNEGVAKKTILRTHTTAVTARYLSTLKREDLPIKVFSIGKVFRNEEIDYKHLPEFYQVEGIVVDENANFRNLLGILKRFYDEMGFKVRFRPAYFPYTEMSVEPEIYFKERKEWIELGGAGIFRSEVVKPLLGFDCPVLAWGLGLDRVVALKLDLNDIRNLYISDLDWLRKGKI